MSWSLPISTHTRHRTFHRGQRELKGKKDAAKKLPQGAWLPVCPTAAVKGYTWMLPALGQMEMEAHGYGQRAQVESLNMGDTGQIIYMRLSGLNGGKMSGLQSQVRGALMTFTRH